MTRFYEDPEKIAAALNAIEARVRDGTRAMVNIDQAAEELGRHIYHSYPLGALDGTAKEWLRSVAQAVIDAGFERRTPGDGGKG